MGAEAGEGGAEAVVGDACHPLRRCRKGGRGGLSAAGRRVFGALDGTLAKRQLADAAPPEMGVDSRQDLIGAVLQLERQTAFDADDKGGGLRRHVGVAAGRARGPLQPDRSRRGREPLAHDVVPVQDEIRFGETLSGEDGIDQCADEIGERARPGAAGFRGRGHGEAA